MFSEVAEIARVAQETQVILILNFTRPHAISNTNYQFSEQDLGSYTNSTSSLVRVYFTHSVLFGLN